MGPDGPKLAGRDVRYVAVTVGDSVTTTLVVMGAGGDADTGDTTKHEEVPLLPPIATSAVVVVIPLEGVDNAAVDSLLLLMLFLLMGKHTLGMFRVVIFGGITVALVVVWILSLLRECLPLLPLLLLPLLPLISAAASVVC